MTSGAEWIFYKIYLGRYVEQMDTACVQLSRFVKEQIAPGRWFFMRYIDGGGAHVRIRWQSNEGSSEDEAGRFETAAEDLFCDLVYAAPSAYRPMVNLSAFVDGQQPPEDGVGSQAFFVRDEYLPELEPFLGPDFIEIAHDVFQESSEIALEVLEREINGGTSRKTIAPALISTAIDIMTDESEDRDFLRLYQDYWTHQQGFNLEYLIADFEYKALSLRDSNYQLDLIPPSHESLVVRWRACLAAACARYGAHIPDRRPFPDNLPFRFIHLMNNRLGINILDEAYLATVLKVYREEEFA